MTRGPGSDAGDRAARRSLAGHASAMAMRLFLLACLGLAWMPSAVFAAPSDAGAGSLPAFASMGVDRPFQAEFITEVMQDRAGFLWIGTREGVYQYDGQRFRKFQHEVQNPDSISSNGIRGMLEDSRGRLWINTISGGLNLLDRSRWRFRSWRHDAADPDSISHDGVFALAEAPGGRLWVGTQAGLDLFDPRTNRFEHRVLATGGEFVMALLRDRQGRLWVGTLDQGLFVQEPGEDGFEPVPLLEAASPPDVFSIAQDERGQVWVGAREGLYRVAANAMRLQPAGLLPAPALGKGLENVAELLPDPAGGLWIGTFGFGLYHRAAGASQATRVPLGPDTSGARHVDQGAMWFGRDGSLFVGSFGAGLFRARLDRLQVAHWGERQEGRPGLSFEDVYALLADGRDGVLAGSFGGGVDRIALGPGGDVAQLVPPLDPSIGAGVTGVLDMLRARDGALWVATSEGVYRSHPARGEFRYFRPGQPVQPGTAPAPGYSYALLEDRRGNVWVGSGGGGLYRYRADTGAFQVYAPQAGNPRSISDDFVTAFLEDARGRLWVGTRSGGLNTCVLAGDALDCRRIGFGGGAGQVSHGHISALLQDPAGAIWVATGGGGLNRLELDREGRVKAVRRWSRNDGLADDNVMALAIAPDGALWLSTHGGISRLDPASGRLHNLTTSDGLPTAVFNPKAALLQGGRLFFGSARGVVALDPLQALSSPPAPPTVIESISGLAAEELPAVPAWRIQSLRLPWRKPFSLEFAVLGFDAGATEFQYRLARQDPWTSLGDRGQLTLQALAPGKHGLEVRGRKDGSAWTFAMPLQIEIVPPWWRRTDVQLGALLLLLATLLGGFWWRVRELHERNRVLQQAQAQREQALAATNESRDRLQEAFAGLRRLTMRLEAAKEQERKHIARELHDEFGQALTATKINLQLARAAPQGEGADARLRDALASVDQLIGQVRALSLDLRPPLLDELGLLPALEAYLHAVSQRSGIPLDMRLPARMPWAGNARDIVVFRIVQEAVTNALRHAGAGRLQVAIEPERGGVLIRVSDDGRGFDADAKLADAAGGFGLFGMRERVRDLGGEWTLRSAPGQGTTMTAFLPGDGDAVEPASGTEGEDARDPGG